MQSVLTGSGLIDGTEDTMTSPIQDVGVDHGCRDIRVIQQFLNGSDFATGFAQMHGKGMVKTCAILHA
jgi:hypothetical protein